MSYFLLCTVPYFVRAPLEHCPQSAVAGWQGRARGSGSAAGAGPLFGRCPVLSLKVVGFRQKPLAEAVPACGPELFGSLLLFALLAAGVAPLSWDLPEPRSRASKIRVHSRGNLWATGHFMGKKSLEPSSPSPLGTAPHTSLRDQRLQLSHDLLGILLLKKALGVSLSRPTPQIQYRRLLVQILQK
uniref:Neuromedin B n=1 Tax=Pan paniscus TaxID=9597 RepID=A0A2R8ZTY6_PANPA